MGQIRVLFLRENNLEYAPLQGRNQGRSRYTKTLRQY